MLQLTYISTASPGFVDADCEAILASSRRNNSASGLTGLLLFNGQRFLQHLEGDEALVMQTYDRIKADPRHRALVLLSRKTSGAPVFGSWNMAFQRVDVALPQTLPLDQQVEALVASIDPVVAAHFMGLAALRKARAA